MSKPQVWITVNGTPVPLDAHGRPRGPVGKKLEQAAGGQGPKSFAQCREETGGDPYRAAISYYTENLMKRPAKPEQGPLQGKEVRFIGRDKEKFRQNLKNDPVKAEAIQYVRDVINTGRCYGPVPSYAGGAGDRFSKIYYFQKKIPMQDEKGNCRTLLVDVGKTKNGEYAYLAHSFTHNEAWNYQRKLEHLRGKGFVVDDAKKDRLPTPEQGKVARHPADPPGGILLHSGHRPPAFLPEVDVADAAVKPLSPGEAARLERRIAAAVQAGMQALLRRKRQAVQDAALVRDAALWLPLPEAGPFAGLGRITLGDATRSGIHG